jgi:hypothetical protein
MSIKRWMFCVSAASVFALAPGCAVEESEPGTTVDEARDNREQVFTDRAEQNLPMVAVTRLARALNEDFAEQESTCGEYSGIRDDRLRELFVESEDLSREFPDLLDNEEALQMIYLGLREILYNASAIRMFRADLETGNYRSVYSEYPDQRKDLLKELGETLDDDEYLPSGDEMPTIIVNVAVERIQLFFEGIKIHEEKVVVGQREYDDYNENSKTRVGDHAIASWNHCYSNDSYPSWCDDKSGGAFGEWTAKLDRGYQYLHGSVGSGILNWAAIKFAPGSHGCVRNRNNHIDWMQEVSPVGTPVRKIYTVTERYARSKRVDGRRLGVGSRRGSRGACEKDPFGDSRYVDFRVRDAKNHYKYDVETPPEDMRDEDRLEFRPNGVYYPDTGVTVGYAHPNDAVEQAF